MAVIRFSTAAFLLVLSLIPAPASAQGGYFGRNKVQYREFDFKVLKTDHFDIYYYPEEAEAAQLAARMAERWYARISKLLAHDLRGRQPLILYASNPHFWQTNTLGGDIGEGTGGVTEAYKRRIVLPFAGPIQATDHVIGHELVHAFQYDITNTNVSSGTPGALGLPLWFIEGMAEYLSIGPDDPHTAMWMREAARREKLPKIKDLDNPRYFPYRYGESLWAFIGGKYGDRVIGDMLRVGANRAGGYEQAIEGVLGVKVDELSAQWHDAIFAGYRPLAEVTKPPGAIARPVVTKETAGNLNVSPELSPDGSKLIFFSEKDLFSIDLYVADAKTGQIIRKITDTATNPHLESLQFLVSAGAWEATGKRFVYPGISKGEPILTIVEVDRGKKDREITVKEVDEILNPAWSPDGNRIAFSGLTGGMNDLFVYDIAASKLTRLTTDAFAELDPAWSPDSKTIAFSTDRFSTKLDTLVPGPLQLALIDVETRAVREAGGFPEAKNISPQWSEDGKSLFFLSDHQGVTNIYRTTIGGQPRQITNLLTGVSGVTALSPALSVANGTLVFSAYENDGYAIYAMDSNEQLAGTDPIPLPIDAGVLPPINRTPGPVAVLLEDPNVGLPPPNTPIPEEPYTPKMGLDFVGQPSVGVGADPFGTYVAGGVSFVFSDMLGNHTLMTGVQATSRFDEIGGSILYLNRTKRLNWGAFLARTPYVARGFAAGFDPQTGAYVEQEQRILQTDTSLQGIVTYPFNRAHRVEASGGYRRIGLKQDLTTRFYDPNSGQQIGEQEEDLGTFPTLNLFEGSGALVYDTSIFGATSPIRGSRYRLEASQSGGDLTYTGALVDARTYLMPVRPFTIALRGLFFGRYGQDAADFRLPTLYLGYPGLVRGYDSNSFEAFECGISNDGTCGAFDRLIGSRVAIANAELRFPLWGAFGGSNFYGPVPVELGVFADAGVAWGQIEPGGPSIGLAEREPVASWGAVARINVLGFAVAEINFVRPLDRPGRGWLWQFNLMPGF
jgi:Tol biopolymer transport system component